MPTDICKMCLQLKPLVSSHLMPASLYPYCYKGEHRPVHVGGGILFPTDRQTQDSLLRTGCEDVLNKGGESWLANKLATWERVFPLYELLTQSPADFDEDGMAVYFTAKNAYLLAEKLIHFALGIFWKASVHPWRGKRVEPRIELGPYSNKIREWLVCGTDFPGNVYLTLVMEKPDRAQITLVEPYESQGHEYHSFNMHVPGLSFMLNIGKTVDEATKWLSFSNNPGHPIAVCDEVTTKFEQLAASVVRASRRTKAYNKILERIAQERSAERN